MTMGGVDTIHAVVGGDRLVGMAGMGATMDGGFMGLLVVFHQVVDLFRLLHRLREPFTHDSGAGKAY